MTGQAPVIILFCFLCLCWQGSLVQSKTNSSSSVPIKTIPEASFIIPESSYQDHVTGSSADHLLIPFQEECIAIVTISIRDNGRHEAELKCTLANGLSYLIPSVSEDWINEQMILGELISAETIMTLPADAMLNQYTHEILLTELPKLWNYEMEERERRRKLRRLATTGTKTLLVVRIQATDATTTPTATQLGNHLFGDDGSNYNFKYQTEACSHNQLTISKASARTGTSTSISNGIVTVSVSVATSVGSTAMINAVTSQLNSQFSVSSPSSLATHVMYCFPPGTMSLDAYAEMGGYLSFYNDNLCIYPSASLHEIGHNYNMGHSSDSSNEYGDKSGAMGFLYQYTYQPKMCYNAAKSWQLGWYSSKAVSVSPSSSSASYTTKLAGIVDYSTTSNKVLIEIRQSSSTTYYYVNYNRATGINAGTQEGANQVQVVSKDTSTESNISMSLSALSAGQSYTISNFNGITGETLSITFTSLENNEANVAITLTGFPTAPTISPSAAPSRTPSKSPSRRPSSSPSSKPSAYAAPSSSPSRRPSSSPSSKPSRIPSVSPSSKPSTTANSPSVLPSRMPSKIPSTRPSRMPSTVPSSKPSTNTNTISTSPSKMPSRSPSRMPSIVPSRTVSLSPSRMPSGAPSILPSLGPSERPSGSAVPTLSEQPSSQPSGSAKPSSSFPPSKQPTGLPSAIPSNQPSISPSATSLTSVSTMPSGTPSHRPSKIPTGSSKPSVSPAPSKQATGFPSSQPSTLPSFSPLSSPSSSVQTPNISPTSPPAPSPRAPTRQPFTSVPTAQIPIQRTATIVIEIGIDGLINLDQICTGIESFLAQGIEAAFQTQSVTTAECTLPQNRRTKVVVEFLDFEKPISIVVTTWFANFQQAPRQFGFVSFLEKFMASQDAQLQLPQYIQQSLGTSVDGIYIRVVETKNNPMLVVAFGDEPPTASPSASTSITDGGASQASAAFRLFKIEYFSSLVIATGIVTLL